MLRATGKSKLSSEQVLFLISCLRGMSVLPVRGMSLRNVTSLGPKIRPILVLNPGTRNVSPIWQTLSNDGPLHLKLVAVGAWPYFNFVSFMT